MEVSANSTFEEIWELTNGLMEIDVYFKTLNTLSIMETQTTTVRSKSNVKKSREIPGTFRVSTSVSISEFVFKHLGNSRNSDNRLLGTCLFLCQQVPTLLSNLGGALSLMLGISLVMMLEFVTLLVKLLLAAVSS